MFDTPNDHPTVVTVTEDYQDMVFQALPLHYQESKREDLLIVNVSNIVNDTFEFESHYHHSEVH